MLRTLALGAILALPLAAVVADRPVALHLHVAAPRSPVARLMQPQLQADPDIEAYYAQRSGNPIWIDGERVRPEARQLVDLLRRAGDHGLNPAAYRPESLSAQIVAARSGDVAALAALELALTKALAGYASDLHGLGSPEPLAFVDAQAPRSPTRLELLEEFGDAPDLTEGLARIQRMNPIYEALRGQLKSAGPDARRLILANLERARLLPPNLGERYLLVDVTAASVEFHQQGGPVSTMRVGVGRPDTPTPSMIGLIRYAVFNPYWNVPPDLVRDRLAPRALKGGPGILDAEGFEVLSDWSDTAAIVPAEAIDWRAVAEGQQSVRVRQRPGPRNMMGRMKFMLPNRLGIYLHDTPYRSALSQVERTVSAGCVRLADASVVSRWLLGDQPPTLTGAAEQRVVLAEPVPVYIVYLTARATPDNQLERRRDIYGQDPALLSWLAKGRDRKAAPSPAASVPIGS